MSQGSAETVIHADEAIKTSAATALDIRAFSHKVDLVMAGLVPAIHVFERGKDVDARPKAGHDGANTDST
jgi:hypothetical protein